MIRKLTNEQQIASYLDRRKKNQIQLTALVRKVESEKNGKHGRKDYEDAERMVVVLQKRLVIIDKQIEALRKKNA